MTEGSKGPFRRIWDKIVDKVGEQIATWLLTLFSLFVLPALIAWLTPARHWIANEWSCIRKPWCEVQGWSLGALIFASAAVAAVAVCLAVKLYKTRRELHAARTASAATKATEDLGVRAETPEQPSFRHVTVEDERLKLRWFIRKPLSAWLHWRNVARTVTPAHVRETLDGPFHSVPGCYAPLEERFRRNSQPALSPECPSCGKEIFRGRPSDSGFGEETVDAFDVRAQALEELQRMERNGAKLDADVPVVLERPAYWKAMLPPRMKRTK